MDNITASTAKTYTRWWVLDRLALYWSSEIIFTFSMVGQGGQPSVSTIRWTEYSALRSLMDDLWRGKQKVDRTKPEIPVIINCIVVTCWDSDRRITAILQLCTSTGELTPNNGEIRCHRQSVRQYNISGPLSLLPSKLGGYISDVRPKCVLPNMTGAKTQQLVSGGNRLHVS